MNYPDSVRFLYSLGNEIKTAKLGLERIRTVLKAMGDPQSSCRFVHVAGTNGKGSTCAMIEAGLRFAGVRTGLFISPHLVEPTERIQVDGSPVAAAEFAAAFDRVHEASEALLREGSIDAHPTYFETVTAMAFLLFREKGVDTVVLEVGLGGRLDATNVVEPRVSVITPVDFDHEALLGSTLEAIAGEKAGILKRGAPAVFSQQRREAETVLAARAADLGIPVARTNEWSIEQLEIDARGSRFSARREEQPADQQLGVTCPLAGRHQVENALTAAVALRQLGVKPDGIAQARWPGRLERVWLRPEILLDGAHNPAGARALAAYIAEFYRGRRVRLVFGAMRDKSIEEIAGILFPLAEELIFTAPNSQRALRPAALLEMPRRGPARVVATVAEAIEMAREAPPDDAVFVTGSLFLAGEARALLVQ